MEPKETEKETPVLSQTRGDFNIKPQNLIDKIKEYKLIVIAVLIIIILALAVYLYLSSQPKPSLPLQPQEQKVVISEESKKNSSDETRRDHG